MPSTYRRLTKRELVTFFEVYRDAFPNWSVEHDTVLTRSEGLIRQDISFEALRDGAYRPSCSVDVLITPPAQLLFRFLDIKHREVLPREHERKWPLLLKAMEEQFLPAVRKPLDVAEVLRVAEQDVAEQGGNINQLTGLAAMNAYLGNNQRALLWCKRIEDELVNVGREPADWKLGRARFARQLREAIDRGQEQSFLSATFGRP